MSISMKNKGIKFYVTFWITCINSWFSASFNIRDKYCTQDSNQSKGKDMRIRKENAKNMTKRKLILLFGKRKNTESKRIHVHIANRKFCLNNICVKLFSEVAQSCPTLCDPVDCSPPGSSVHRILQARILEWVAISFSRGSSQLRDWTRVSCMAGRCFLLWATREAPWSCSCR